MNLAEISYIAAQSGRLAYECNAVVIIENTNYWVIFNNGL